MKTKLTVNNKDEFVGYRNVNLENIKEIHDNSCFELYIDNDIMKNIHNNEFSDFISLCCSKIRIGGTILLTGVDFNKITLSYIHKYMNEKDISNLLSGSNGFYTCAIVEKELKKNGIKIHSMSISNNNFIVRGIRD